MEKIYTTKPVKEFIESVDYRTQELMSIILSFILVDKTMMTGRHFKHVSVKKYSELYEMRLRPNGKMARVLLVFSDGDVKLLHAFYKKDNKDNMKAFEKAYKILNSDCEFIEIDYEFFYNCYKDGLSEEMLRLGKKYSNT